MSLDEPLHPLTVARLIRKIVADGSVQWSRHARQRLMERGLNEDACADVLRCGVVVDSRLEGGTWRYRFHHGATTLVLAIKDAQTLTVVTVWREED